MAIGKKQYITAMKDCAVKFNKDNNFIEFSEDFSQDDYWKKLQANTNTQLSEDKLSSRRSAACKTFEELKFNKSTYNVQVEVDGETKHLSDLLSDNWKDLKALFQKIEEDTISGAELSKLVLEHDRSNPAKMEEKRYDLANNDLFVSQIGLFSNPVGEFVAEEAYANLNPEKIFYPDGRGRGRPQSINTIDSFDM